MNYEDKITLKRLDGLGQEYIAHIDSDGIPVTNKGRRLEQNVDFSVSEHQPPINDLVSFDPKIDTKSKPPIKYGEQTWVKDGELSSTYAEGEISIQKKSKSIQSKEKEQ